MSVFRGSVIECPGIIIDHFTPSNCLRGQAFFLSHCHRDHMTGLDSDELLFALKSKNTHLYCSEVTKGLLTEDAHFTKLIPLMRSLPVEEQVIVKLLPTREDQGLMNISVTLLPAGHCPGSVMFLFQWNSCCVLYTGDFRLSVSELRKMNHLHTSADTGAPIEIDTLYLDTTFCHEQANSIISREKTNEYILETVETWLSSDPLTTVYLDCPSFGYEHIFLSLSKHFKTKIHIAPWRMRSYSVLPEVQECLTLDGENTRIHSCGFRKKLKMPGLPCECCKGKNGRPSRTLRIKPSTQWFVTSHGRLNHPKVHFKSINMVRVLHSMHASYSELCAFVSYLSPHSVVPCVIPYSLGDTSIVNLHDRIRKLLPFTSSSVVDTVTKHITNEDNAEKLTVQRKDPVCYEADDEDEFGTVVSDYETDDEFVCSDDLSHDLQSSSPDHSFDLSTIPAFVDDSKAVLGHSSTAQPSIDLSFSEDSTKFTSENGSQQSRDNDNVASTNDAASLPLTSAIGVVDTAAVILTNESSNDSLSTIHSKKRSSELLPELMSSQPKRRKLFDNQLETHVNRRRTNISVSSSESPPSSVCIVLPRELSCSPVSIIDLTRSSSSDRDKRESATPDSVIITGTSLMQHLEPTAQQPYTVEEGSVCFSRGSTPIRSVAIHETTPLSPVPHSPSFLPPTPGRNTNNNNTESSILGNTSFGFL